MSNQVMLPLGVFLLALLQQLVMRPERQRHCKSVASTLWFPVMLKLFGKKLMIYNIIAIFTVASEYL